MLTPDTIEILRFNGENEIDYIVPSGKKGQFLFEYFHLGGRDPQAHKYPTWGHPSRIMAPKEHVIARIRVSDTKKLQDICDILNKT